MEITIAGKGVKVGEQLKEKIEKKLKKYERFFPEGVTATVKIRPEGEKRCLEITIKNKGHYLRAETVADDVLVALDETISALDRQIRKQKTRIAKHIHDYAHLQAYLRGVDEDEAEVIEDETLSEGALIRRKSFDIEPMTTEEACLQMELLGHNFLLFLSPETERVCLVYKRHDGNYGLLEPQY